jgi:ABC-type nitrate/sulfonate/bicarbonate transport system substrate-binding protein
MKVMWFAPPAVALAAQGLALPGADAIESTRTRGSDEQFDMLVRGDCDAVVTAMDNVFAWNRRPGPGDFCIVAQIERTTPLVVMARPGIPSLAALRGANLLIDAPGNGFVIALRALLRAEGLGLDDYRFIEAGGVKERLDALLAGQGDATLLGPPFDTIAAQGGQQRLATVQERYPQFPGQGLVVSRSALPRFEATLRRWLHALDGVCQHAVNAAVATTEALQRAGGLEAAGAAAMQRGIPATLVPDRIGVELLATMRRELGLPGADDPYDTLVHTALLPR